VCRGLSVGIFFASLSVVHLALVQRAMRFVGTSVNDVLGRAVNTIIAIVLALRGWGYWALVIGIVGQQISVTIGSWLMCSWVPSLPRRTGKTSPMVRFAVKVYGQFSVAYFTRNIDNLLVGWRFNAVALGFYKKAFDLFALTASQLTAPMNNVALAALSRLHQDHDRFRRSLASSLGMVALLGMGVSADLTLVGRDVVRVVLGSKWSEAGRIFEIFGPGIGAMLLCSTVSWVHLSIGKPGRLLRWGIFSLAVTVSAFLVALRWGPLGVAAAWSISYWVLLLPSFWYAGQPIGFRVSDLVSAVWRYTAAGLASGLATAAIMRRMGLWETPSTTEAALGAACAISLILFIVYIAAVVVFHGGIAPFRQFANLLGELAPSRKKDSQAEVDANAIEEHK
jgi:O-antigen/teichoic acid export membrane protein